MRYNMDKKKNAVLTAGKQQEKIIGRPFKKGQSGNSKGRPKGSLSLVSLLKEELEKFIKTADKKERVTYAKALIRKVLKKAIVDEDIQMMKDILNRVDGMPKQAIEMDNKGGIEIVHKYADDKKKGGK